MIDDEKYAVLPAHTSPCKHDLAASIPDPRADIPYHCNGSQHWLVIPYRSEDDE
jgi:hypothetical protein